MNRTQLIDEYHARRQGHSREASAQQVDLFFQIMKDTLQEGEKLAIHNFGTISVVERSSRMGRNPRKNQPIEIPERKGIRFKPSRSLIDLIQGDAS